MASRDRFSLRLPSDLASELRRYASDNDMAITAVIVEALKSYIQGDAQGDVRNDAADIHEDTREKVAGDGVSVAVVDALTTQLEVKDRQIARLMDALSQAQETAHAAQVLEGAHMAKALDGDVEGSDGHERESGGLMKRIRRWLRS